jgi:hypothetical protein
MLVRGGELDPDVLRDSGRANFVVYGFYGVSVWRYGDDEQLADLAATKLRAASVLALFDAGDLAAAGLELWDTGQAPHYDVVATDAGSDLDALVYRLTAAPCIAVDNEFFVPEGGDW